MAGEQSFISITDSGNRLETLKALRHKLASALEQTESARDIPPLSKQLREVMDEIESLDHQSDVPDNVTVLAMIRAKHGKEA